MKSMVKSLILTSICFSSTIQAQSQPRGIYPFGFGGLDALEVNDAVDLLMEHGYTGILPEVGSRSQQDIRRLKQYLNRSALEGEAFNVMGIYTNHKIYLEEHGYDNSFQKQMIDILANRGGGTLWMAVRAVQNQNDPVDYDKVNQFIQGVFEYAIEGPQDKNVDIIFYPHVNNAYESTVEALTLVEEINHPKFKISINLIHEYHAGLADSTSLSQTFELTGEHLGAVLLGGIQTGDDFSILSLEDSEYDLGPFLNILTEQDSNLPIGFVNFQIPQPQNSNLSYPESYLKNSINEWSQLCQEFGLVDEQTTSIYNSHPLSPTKSKNLFLFNAQGRVVHTQPNFPQPKYTQ